MRSIAINILATCFSFFPAFWKSKLRFSLVQFQFSKDSYLWEIDINNNVHKIFHSGSALALPQTATTLLFDGNSYIRSKMSEGPSGSERLVSLTVILTCKSGKEKASDSSSSKTQGRNRELIHLFSLLYFTKICMKKRKAHIPLPKKCDGTPKHEKDS